ncbi:MAG: RNA-binding protein [Kiritimatiellae bacterium]|nr:RNA-binding protein [Kiritimatiellia bacterium]
MGGNKGQLGPGRKSPAGGSESQVPETTLKTDRIHVERKDFIFTLRENARGRFLRITEDVNGRRDTIIVPAPGLEDFIRVMRDMAAAASQKPDAGG